MSLRSSYCDDIFAIGAPLCDMHYGAQSINLHYADGSLCPYEVASHIRVFSDRGFNAIKALIDISEQHKKQPPFVPNKQYGYTNKMLVNIGESPDGGLICAYQYDHSTFGIVHIKFPSQEDKS